MRSTWKKTLGLSMAMLSLLASLAIAAPPVVMQGTVTAIDNDNQAIVRLEDGTMLTIREKPWQKGWQVGDRLQCTTEQRPSPSGSGGGWNGTTICEQP
jgi:hypothetical protein